MWEEEAVAYFNVLSTHLLGGKRVEPQFRSVDVATEFRTSRLSDDLPSLASLACSPSVYLSAP